MRPLVQVGCWYGRIVLTGMVFVAATLAISVIGAIAAVVFKYII